MRTRTFLAIALLALGHTTIANDDGNDASLHVDVDTIVDAGQIRAVDGVTSSGQPDQAALAVFSESGYVAVIDLRGVDENRGIDEQAAVEQLGMDYVLFPITSRDDISFANAERLDALIGSYEGPVLVHCGSGNRVGALLALRESLNGTDDEAAVEYGRAGGLTGLEGVVRERLATPRE